MDASALHIGGLAPLHMIGGRNVKKDIYACNMLLPMYQETLCDR